MQHVKNDYGSDIEPLYAIKIDKEKLRYYLNIAKVGDYIQVVKEFKKEWYLAQTYMAHPLLEKLGFIDALKDLTLAELISVLDKIGMNPGFPDNIYGSK